MISGDSDEYEFLSEAVELSAGVEGMCAEVGVRLGMGTKTIIDACCQYRKGTTVVSIDPYGHIPYIGREPNGECRLDYTNDMGKTCMADLSQYVLDKPVFWQPFKMTAERYFYLFSAGLELYDMEAMICNKYAMAHMDGIHTVDAVTKEVRWFNDRMDSGSTIVIDDITPDFFDIRPINSLFTDVLGWEILKQGGKKGVYRKL